MVVHYVVGDVFASPTSHALAHCVAADLRQGAGIAKHFVRRFGGRDQLVQQCLEVGDVGVVDGEAPDGERRVILVMVTKAHSPEPPRAEDFDRTLMSLRLKCEQLGVRVVSCPMIGTGRDHIPTIHVKRQLQAVFGESAVCVVVWRQKAGPSAPTASLLHSGCLVAGDSNMLRVLMLEGKGRPNTIQGLVQSGGSMRSVQYTLQAAGHLTERIFVMAGTNDLLELHRSGAGPRSVVLRKMKGALRRFLLAVRKLRLNVAIVTIPPLPKLLLGHRRAPISVAEFNGMLSSRAARMGFPVVDVNSRLQLVDAQVGPVVGTDGVHLTPLGAGALADLLV
jgi:hypothetical protein